ncbi:DUF1572 family protein [Heyndrickxia sp. NPDC080065]
MSYNLGQCLYLCKQIKDNEWTLLSIPKNGSQEINKKFANNLKET